METVYGSPAASSEVLALRSRILDLETALGQAQADRMIRTGEQLVNVVTRLLPGGISREAELFVSEDEDGDLTLTFQGVTLDGDYLSLREREYRVEGTVTIPVTFTVMATSQDDADEKAEEVLSEATRDLDVSDNYSTDAVDAVEYDSTHPDYEVLRVTEE